MSKLDASSRQASPGPEILQEAARWFVLLASGEATDADRVQWRAWRSADPRHEAGWQRAEAVTAPFANIPGAQAGPSINALEQTPGRRLGRRRVLGSLAALVGTAWLGWQGWRRSDLSADAVTAVGEQRDHLLADGTQLRLDTDSAVDIVFDAQQRLVRLRRGRVLITTGKGQAGAKPAPFWVETAQGRIQALGTRFAVRQWADATDVAVLEDRVAVQAGTALLVPQEASIISAGQAVRFNRQGVVERRPSNPSDSAWARGILIADDMPLLDFVAELSRYRAAPILCEPAVQGLRISGTYPLADTDRVLASLSRTLPVRVVARRDGDEAAGLLIQHR